MMGGGGFRELAPMRGLVDGGRFNWHRCDLRRRGRQLTDLVSLGKRTRRKKDKKDKKKTRGPVYSISRSGGGGGEQQKRERLMGWNEKGGSLSRAGSGGSDDSCPSYLH